VRLLEHRYDTVYADDDDDDDGGGGGDKD